MNQQLQDIIQSLPARFKKVKGRTYQGVFHLKLGQGNEFTLSIAEGNCELSEGLHGVASCSLEASPEDYIALETGVLNPMEAFVSQKIKTDNTQEAMQFGLLFIPYHHYQKQERKVEIPARKPQKGPLKGIRILDFTRLLPGPLATMMLADMGAEVIKIEHPDFPDYVRNYPPFINGVSANYVALNRSKRSMLLDYQSEEGKELFFDLLKTADIVVEQFRPGVMDAWGIGYAAAQVHHPEINYISLTGYGQTGEFSQKAGHDLNYIAYAGILGLNKDKNDHPVIPGVQLADIAAGAYMTVSACTTALLAKQQTGKGQQVDVAMLDGLMPMLSLPFVQYQATGVVSKNTDLPLSGGLANYQVYECADGKWLALGALEPKFWANFCELIAQPVWAQLDQLALAKSKTLIAEVARIVKTKTQAEWLHLAADLDVCLSPVAALEDLEGNLHLKQRNMLLTEQHPTMGTFKNIGVPLKFSKTPAAPSWSAPELGEDTTAIIDELNEAKKEDKS